MGKSVERDHLHVQEGGERRTIYTAVSDMNCKIILYTHFSNDCLLTSLLECSLNRG
jgi:hypothetical protein